MISFKRVTKTYPGGHTVIRDLNLEINAGQFVCLIGPSGCGKTTTLKMINRLFEPTSGQILVNGQEISTADPVQLRRNIGYVIQQVGLFPHMTIADNIGLVPKLQGWDASRIESRVDELLNLVGLDPAAYRNRYPRQLSGGQQQRVGVLRALAAEPDLILMDEPFGALDPITRESLQDELKRLKSRLKKTIVFVTHDMDEALKLADRVIIMKEGAIVQDGTPDDILRNPCNQFVAEFIGHNRVRSAAESIMVQDLMIRNPVTCGPDQGLAAAVERMRQKRVDSLMIVDQDDLLLGVVTAREIGDARGRARSVREVMQPEAPRVQLDAPVSEALQRMFVEQLSHLPVADPEGHLVGLITRTALVDLLARTNWLDNGQEPEA